MAVVVPLARPEGDSARVLGSGPYPPILEEEPSFWMEHTSPEPAILWLLLNELREYLGGRTFSWLAATAVFPQLHPELTMHLGCTVKEEGQAIGSEDGLLALSRLPWFREGMMPDWLRGALLTSLSEELKDEVRTSLYDVLLTARSGARAGLVLDISRTSVRAITGLFERLAASGDIQKSQQINPLREQLFLAFMRGTTPPSSVLVPLALIKAVKQRINLVVATWLAAILASIALWRLDPWTMSVDFYIRVTRDTLVPLTVFPLILLYVSYRAKAIRGPVRALSWLVGTIALVGISAGYFSRSDFDWPGMNNLGWKLGLLLALVTGLGLLYHRRSARRAVETALYGFGCLWAASFLIVLFTSGRAMSWWGMDPVEFAAALAILSSLVIWLWLAGERRFLSNRIQHMSRLAKSFFSSAIDFVLKVAGSLLQILAQIPRGITSANMLQRDLYLPHPTHLVYAIGVGVTITITTLVVGHFTQVELPWLRSLLCGFSLSITLYGIAFSRWFHLQWSVVLPNGLAVGLGSTLTVSGLVSLVLGTIMTLVGAWGVILAVASVGASVGAGSKKQAASPLLFSRMLRLMLVVMAISVAIVSLELYDSVLIKEIMTTLVQTF